MSKIVKYCAILLSVLGILFTSVSYYFYSTWQADNRILYEFGAKVLGDRLIDGKSVELLNDRIYHIATVAKERDAYFLLRSLGATPVAVLKYGGDCADKSRLLAAVLGEIGTAATLVMLRSCPTCAPEHTVVEARATDGPVVVDPVYNISFPSPDGGYNDIRSLRAAPGLLQERLAHLIENRGSHDKIARYNHSTDGLHYGFPQTINWHKNFITRIVGTALGLFVEEATLVYRPRFLEDPKLLFTLASLGIGLGSTITGFGLLLACWIRHRAGTRKNAVENARRRTAEMID